MLYAHLALCAVLTLLIAGALWTALRPTPSASRKEKATTLPVIALSLVLVWIAYYRFGAAGIIPLL